MGSEHVGNPKACGFSCRKCSLNWFRASSFDSRMNKHVRTICEHGFPQSRFVLASVASNIIEFCWISCVYSHVSIKQIVQKSVALKLQMNLTSCWPHVTLTTGTQRNTRCKSAVEHPDCRLDVTTGVSPGPLWPSRCLCLTGGAWRGFFGPLPSRGSFRSNEGEPLSGEVSLVVLMVGLMVVWMDISWFLVGFSGF